MNTSTNISQNTELHDAEFKKMVSEMLGRILDNLIDLNSPDDMPPEEHPFNKLVEAIAEMETGHVQTHREIVSHMVKYQELLQTITDDSFKTKESVFHLATAMREFSDKLEKFTNTKAA